MIYFKITLCISLVKHYIHFRKLGLGIGDKLGEKVKSWQTYVDNILVKLDNN